MRISKYIIVVWIGLLSASASLSQPSRPNERGKYAYLEIMHESQSPDLCLPTCVAMAMNYYGDGKTQWTLKRLSNEHKDLFSTTTFEEVQSGIKKIGYTWDRWRWHNDSAGFHNAISALQQSLDDKRPVIVSIKVPVPNNRLELYHAMLVFGYDQEKGKIFILDPARPFPGKRIMTFDELRQMWNENGILYCMFTAKGGDVPTGHPR
ncbi:MAG TPA: C39 family peptidase [Candidatus Kapabacteria bacterium]|jgi:ABC-type bacteriocin/lantibiotic exporter with double-glycine peptidase domain